MPWETGLALTSSFLLMVLAAVKARHARRELVARQFLVCLVLLGLFQLAVAWSRYSAEETPVSILPVYAVFLLSLIVLPFWHALSFTFGRENPAGVLERHRVHLIVHGVTALILAGLLSTEWFVQEVGVRKHVFVVILGPAGKAFLIYAILALASMGVNLESTYRSASARVRVKFKYAFTGAFAALAYYVFANSLGLLFSASNFSYLFAGSVPVSVAALLFGYSLLKRQLVDTRVPVARSVFYTSFTISGIALYILALGLFGKLTQLAGWELTRTAAIALGFLAIFSLLVLVISSRVQRAVKRFVDRNFYVNRYDYRHQWRKLTRALNPALSGSEIERVALEITSELLWAKSVCIFLKDQKNGGYSLSSSTSYEGKTWRLANDDKLVQLLLKNKRSIILDRDPKNFEYVPVYIEDAELLDNLNIHVCTPLIVEGKMMGILACGPKKGNIPYNYEDIELLDTMSGQIANALSRAILSRDLAEAKELESFHRFSSFVLHDLKNLASTLGLLAANAEQNMNNPEFQADVMKIVSSTSQKMKSLIAKISRLPKTMELELKSCEVADILEAALAESGLASDKVNGIDVVRELRPLPRVLADPGQIKKVFTNLLVNAVEAMPEGGRIKLKADVTGVGDTERGGAGNGAAVMIQVSDTGCGMDEGFIEEKLFRPFSSTKPKGLGIGLYQSKEIVEAHKGRLEVESKRGEGTTFTVLLPVDQNDPGRKQTIGSDHGEE